MTLFEQFLKEECDSSVRAMLLATLDLFATNSPLQRKVFELNRFDVTLDRETGIAELQDDLDVPEKETLRISLQELRSELESLSL